MNLRTGHKTGKRLFKAAAAICAAVMLLSPCAAFADGFSSAIYYGIPDFKTAEATGHYGCASTIYYGGYWQHVSVRSSLDQDQHQFHFEGIPFKILSDQEVDANGKKTLTLFAENLLFGSTYNTRDSSTGLYGRYGQQITSHDSNKWAFERVNLSTGETEIISSDIRTALNNRTKTQTTANPTPGSGGGDLGVDLKVDSWGGFAGDAFSDTEYAAIATMNVNNSYYDGTSLTTKDKLYLLTIEDILPEGIHVLGGYTVVGTGKYGFNGRVAEPAEGPNLPDSLNARLTQAAQGSTKWYGSVYGQYENYRDSDPWVTRSQHPISSGEGRVWGVTPYTEDISAMNEWGSYGVRPALNLSLDDLPILFFTAAGTVDYTSGKYQNESGDNRWYYPAEVTGGKSALGVGDGFNLTGNGEETGYVMTLKALGGKVAVYNPLTRMSEGDKYLGRPVVKTLSLDGEGASGGTFYRVATTTDAAAGTTAGEILPETQDHDSLYISGFIGRTTEDGGTEYVNYGKVGHTTDTEKKLNFGTQMVVPEDGDYNLTLYTEQVNGVRMTDYAGEFASTPFTMHVKDNKMVGLTIPANFNAAENSVELKNGFAVTLGAHYTDIVTGEEYNKYNQTFTAAGTYVDEVYAPEDPEYDPAHPELTHPVYHGTVGKIIADSSAGGSTIGGAAIQKDSTLVTANTLVIDGSVAAAEGATLKNEGALGVSGEISAAGGLTIENAGTAMVLNKITAGEDAKISNADPEGITAIDGAVTVGANAEIENGGLMTFTGKVNAGAGAKISSEGIMAFTDSVSAGADAEISNTGIMTFNSLSVGENSQISNTGAVIFSGEVTGAAGSLLNNSGTAGAKVSGLGIPVENSESGSLILEGGTAEAPAALRQNISVATGKGSTAIDGSVINKAEISGDLLLINGADSVFSNEEDGKISAAEFVNEGKVTTNADSITSAEISSSGTVTFTGGTLNGNYTSLGGVTNFNNNTINGNYTSKGGTSNFAKGAAAVKFKGDVDLQYSRLNFTLDGVNAGDTMVESDKTINLRDTDVRICQTEARQIVKDDETVTLINNANDYVGTKDNPQLARVVPTTGMFDYLYGSYVEDSKLLLGVGAPVTTNPFQPVPPPVIVKDQTKSFSEARLALSAAINNAGDLVEGQAINNLSLERGEWEAFAAMGGSRSKYDTGSDFTLNSFSAAAGLSNKINDTLTLGFFVEGGNGRYDTMNEFATDPRIVTSKGDFSYMGVGALVKAESEKTATGQLHAEASIRTGHISGDYNSENFNAEESVRFDTSSSYVGAHAGLGYKWNITDNSTIDTYVKYLWSRQNGDSPVINGVRFDLDEISSRRLRAGFRYKQDKTENLKAYAGLAYEHEFAGTASGHVDEHKLLEPDIKGGSAMAELGVQYQKQGSPWKIDLGLQGFTGRKESISANLGAWYEIDKLARGESTNAVEELRRQVKQLEDEISALKTANNALRTENAAIDEEIKALRIENLELRGRL